MSHDTAQVQPPLELNNSIDAAFSSADFVTSASWMGENWWEVFKDDQLNRFIEKALANNPNLQMALERVSLAHMGAKQAFAPMLPSLDAQFEELFAAFTWNKKDINKDYPFLPGSIVPRWINLLSTFLNFRWRVDLWGSQKQLYRSALDQVKMQMAELSYANLMLSTQLAHAYFNVQYYLSLKELQNEQLATMNSLLELQEEIFANALGDEETLLTIEHQILEWQNQLNQTDQEIALNMNQLKALMGLNADEPIEWSAPVSSFGFSFPFPENFPIQLLARRPDVVAKIWAVEAMAKRVKSAKVAFLPTIDLGSVSGFLSLNWDTLLKPSGWFTSIIPMASLPIFKGLQLRSNLQYSARQYNIAVLDYNQTLLNAAKEVVDSITTFRISNQQWVAQEKVIQKSQNLMELASLRYEYGLNNNVDVLKTKLRLIEDEINLSQYNQLHMLATLNLIKSLGGGYSCPELQAANEEEATHE